MQQKQPIDPNITEAMVVGGKVAKVGDGVKHWNQRFTGDATAEILGFYIDRDASIKNWIKVVVRPFGNSDGYGNAWDWDCTELCNDDL